MRSYEIILLVYLYSVQPIVLSNNRDELHISQKLFHYEATNIKLFGNVIFKVGLGIKYVERNVSIKLTRILRPC